jgi:hypothetical protein
LKVDESDQGFFITGINTGAGNLLKSQPIDEAEEDDPSDPADFYRHVAIVDCSRAFSNSECVVISDKKDGKKVTYLNASSLVQFKFDSLITSHTHVQHICDRLIHKFLHPRGKGQRDKIILNLGDQFNSNNNAGFNLTNFKVKFIN